MDTLDLLRKAAPLAGLTGAIAYVAVARIGTDANLIRTGSKGQALEASNSATSGAFVLSESYLYHEEMIAEAYDHLTPDGMVVIQFGDFDFDTRPTRTARYLVTAREAFRDEQTEFAL
jgi:hypothetical protein